MTEPILTGIERKLGDNDLIVTKTDLGGRITYANGVFLNISALTEPRALGAPHNIIRHPRMPGCIFRLLWDTVQRGQEIFAYVLNRATNGDHYWVFAHVTPTFDRAGAVSGYHSNRRVPDRRVVEGVVEPLYRELLRAEGEASSRGKGIDSALGKLNDFLQAKGVDYDRFIFSLQN